MLFMLLWFDTLVSRNYEIGGDIDAACAYRTLDSSVFQLCFEQIVWPYSTTTTPTTTSGFFSCLFLPSDWSHSIPSYLIDYNKHKSYDRTSHEFTMGDWKLPASTYHRPPLASESFCPVSHFQTQTNNTHTHTLMCVFCNAWNAPCCVFEQN